MNSLCLFSSFFEGNEIPYYIKVYLGELRDYFTEIIFLTNEKNFDEGKNYLAGKNIQLRMYKNEGYDFGMWYKAFNEVPVYSYDRVALVNDSCILFKSPGFFFEWIEKNNFDYSGMTDSNAVSYHIQSYLVIINKTAIQHVRDYFEAHKIKEDIRDVITEYEVGLSSYLINKKMRLGAYFKNNNFTREHNPMLYFSDDLVRKGIPLIKKKIIYCSFRKEELFSLMRMNFNIDPRHHIQLIRKVNGNNLIIDFNLLTKKIFTRDILMRIRIYKIKSFLFQIIRKIKHGRIKV